MSVEHTDKSLGSLLILDATVEAPGASALPLPFIIDISLRRDSISHLS
jgi:hypothetical protein